VSASEGGDDLPLGASLVQVPEGFGHLCQGYRLSMTGEISRSPVATTYGDGGSVEGATGATGAIDGTPGIVVELSVTGSSVTARSLK